MILQARKMWSINYLKNIQSLSVIQAQRIGERRDFFYHGTANDFILRRSQFKLAEKNAAMAIFLGKQYLGQKDIPDVSLSDVPDDGFAEAIKGTAQEDWKVDDV